MAKEDFNLLDSLTASLGESEEELQCAQDTKASKEQEKAVLDIAESRGDEEANRGIELDHVSMIC